MIINYSPLATDFDPRNSRGHCVPIDILIGGAHDKNYTSDYHLAEGGRDSLIDTLNSTTIGNH